MTRYDLTVDLDGAHLWDNDEGVTVDEIAIDKIMGRASRQYEQRLPYTSDPTEVEYVHLQWWEWPEEDLIEEATERAKLWAEGLGVTDYTINH